MTFLLLTSSSRAGSFHCWPVAPSSTAGIARLRACCIIAATWCLQLALRAAVRSAGAGTGPRQAGL